MKTARFIKNSLSTQTLAPLRLLIIVLAILAGLQGTSDARAGSCSPVEKGIGITSQGPHLKAKNTAGSVEAGAKRFTEENKASANASELYDTVMPPLCLLMLVWLSLTLSGSEKGKS